MRHFKTPLARRFNGTSQYLASSSAIIAAEPFTMACWFLSASSTAAQNLISIDRGLANGFYRLAAMGNVAGDPIRCHKQADAGTDGPADSTTGYTANTWTHACGVWAADNSRIAYCNGRGAGTNTTNVADPSVTQSSIGVLRINVNTQFMDGLIVWPVVWNITLTVLDVERLALGAHPFTIHPESIVAFWDWDGADTEFGLRGTYPLTNTGSTPVNGPGFLRQEIRKPRRRFNSVGGGAAFKPYWALRRAQVIGGGTL